MTLMPSAPVSTILKVLAAIAAAVACVAVVLAAVPLPYPILTDLDSSFVSFLANADAHGLQAGRDYVFTYGPLGSWYVPTDFDTRLLAAAVLRTVSALAVAAYLWTGPRPLRGAVIAVGALYLVFLDFNGPMLAVLLTLCFALPRRSLPFILLVVAVSTVWGLVKFSGAAGLGLVIAFYAVAAAILDPASIRRTAAVVLSSALTHAVVVGAVYHGYLDQSPLDYLGYLRWSSEVARGYSHYMGQGFRPLLIVGFLITVAAPFALHAWSQSGGGRTPGAAGSRSWRVLGLERSAILPLLCAIPVLFLAWKQGFTRQDGHEASAYLVAFVYASLVLAEIRLPDRAVLPLQAILAICGAIVVTMIQGNGIRPGIASFTGQLSALPSRAMQAAALMRADQRTAVRRNVEERNRTAVRSLAQSVPILERYRGFDIFAPEQSLALVNWDAYRPRPVFQGYSAYTSALQDLNAAHVERVPDEFFVKMRPIDGRFPNLEDGSALGQILLQFCPDELYGDHASVRRTEPHLDLAAIDRLDWTDVRLDTAERVELPPGVVLGRLDIEPSLLGRLVAAVFRLPTVNAFVTLSDGSEQRARLIPTGARYPAVLSPWLDSAEALLGLWAGGGTRSVAALRLDVSGWKRAIFDRVVLHYAPIDWAGVTAKCTTPARVTQAPPAGASVQNLPGGLGRVAAVDAHPNRAVAFPVEHLSHVTAVLRLRSPETVASRSDGVDVALYGYKDGRRTPIFEMRAEPGQFGPAATLPVFDGPVSLDGGFLVFETSDANTSWDWYTWDSIELR